MKGYSGEDTKKGAFWENNTVSKFSLILLNYHSDYIISNGKLNKLVNTLKFKLKELIFQII